MKIVHRAPAPVEVLYTYHCAACAHRGELYLPGDSHDGAPAICSACGAPVWIEWGGGTTFPGDPAA